MDISEATVLKVLEAIYPRKTYGPNGVCKEYWNTVQKSWVTSFTSFSRPPQIYGIVSYLLGILSPVNH